MRYATIMAVLISVPWASSVEAQIKKSASESPTVKQVVGTAAASASQKKGGKTTSATRRDAPAASAPEALADEASSTTAQLPSLDKVNVREVRRLGDASQKTPVIAGFNDRIEIVVDDLTDLTLRSKCLSTNNTPVENCKKHDITLFLDGREIAGLVPESGAPEPKDGTGTLQFHLDRSAASDETWADLLGSPPWGKEFFTRGTDLSVGLEGGYALPSAVSKTEFRLIRILESRFWITAIVLLLTAALLAYSSTGSGLLRDVGTSPVPLPADYTPRRVGRLLPVGGAVLGLLAGVWGGIWAAVTFGIAGAVIVYAGVSVKRASKDAAGAKSKPYSLARVQMAVWFFLTVGAFLFIWSVTRATNTLNASVLALLGISAGTFLGATAIEKENQTKKNVPAAQTQGFWADILGGDDASFHRLQMFVWTLVLAVLFIISVWTRLSMPTFDATLLGLTGISSGTYLGFKFHE